MFVDANSDSKRGQHCQTQKNSTELDQIFDVKIFHGFPDERYIVILWLNHFRFNAKRTGLQHRGQLIKMLVFRSYTERWRKSRNYWDRKICWLIKKWACRYIEQDSSKYLMLWSYDTLIDWLMESPWKILEVSNFFKSYTSLTNLTEKYLEDTGGEQKKGSRTIWTSVSRSILVIESFFERPLI